MLSYVSYPPVFQSLYEIYPHRRAARSLVDGVSSILVHVVLNSNELSFALISVENHYHSRNDNPPECLECLALPRVLFYTWLPFNFGCHFQARSAPTALRGMCHLQITTQVFPCSCAKANHRSIRRHAGACHSTMGSAH